MFVEDQMAGIAQAQYALQTIAAVWQLTNFEYPPILSKVNDGSSYDYIVAGAGSAGSVVASRLSENPNVTVLLIEAGGVPPIQSNLPGGATFLQNSYVDWDQTQQSQVDTDEYQCIRDKRQPISHGKMLGGSSSINLMLYMRGVPHDFDRWADITGDPIWKYENVLKYFIKTQRIKDDKIINSPLGKYYGTKGVVGVSKLYSDVATQYLKIYEEMGFPHVLDSNGNGSLGFSEQMVTVADRRRQSTANAHLVAAKGRSNLHILIDSTVSKIIIDEDKVARGVEYLDSNNNTHKVYAKREVILSAGAINSPQVLMLSGVGPEDLLKEFNITCLSNVPAGQQIINHHGPFLIYKADKLDETAEQPATDPGAFPVPIVTGLLTLNKTQDYPDYMAATVMLNAEAMALTFCSIVFAFDRQTCQTLYDDTKGRAVLFVAIVDFNQKSKGHMRLKSLDPKAPMDYTIHAYANENHFQTVVDYAMDFNRILNTTHYKSVDAELATLPQCSQYDKNSRDYMDCYMRCMSSTYYHYCGTNAMGLVTDSRLRVKGIKRLRVVDSSAIPAITSGTPNAPIMMLGEVGADLIKQDNGT